MDSVAHGVSVFFVHGLATETQVVKRKAAKNESFIYIYIYFWGGGFGAGLCWGDDN